MGVSTGNYDICFKSFTAVIAKRVAFSDVGSIRDCDMAIYAY